VCRGSGICIRLGEGLLEFFEFGSFAWFTGTFAIAVSQAGGDSIRAAEGGAALFMHEAFVALDFGQGIFGVGCVAFLAGAVALAFGLVDDAENGFTRFFLRFRQAFGIAADAGAIATPVVDVVFLAVVFLDYAGAIPRGGIAFGVPVGIGAVFGMAFAADAAAGGGVDVAGGRWKRWGTIGHEFGRDGFGSSFGYGVLGFGFGRFGTYGRDARGTIAAVPFGPGEVGAAAVIIAVLQAG